MAYRRRRRRRAPAKRRRPAQRLPILFYSGDIPKGGIQSYRGQRGGNALKFFENLGKNLFNNTIGGLVGVRL